MVGVGGNAVVQLGGEWKYGVERNWRQVLGGLPAAGIRASQAKSWLILTVMVQNKAEAAGETANDQEEAGG